MLKGGLKTSHTDAEVYLVHQDDVAKWHPYLRSWDEYVLALSFGNNFKKKDAGVKKNKHYVDTGP